MSLHRRMLPQKRRSHAHGTVKSLTRIITVSPGSRGLRINIDGCAVLVTRDGDSVIVTTVTGERVSTVNATEGIVSVRILAKGQTS